MFRLTMLQIRGTRFDNALRELPALGLAGLIACLLIFVPFPLDVAIIAAPLGAVLLLTSPLLLPLFLIVSVPAQDALPIPEGIPLTLTRVAVLAVVAVAPLIVLGSTRRLRIPWILPVAGAFVAVLGATTWNANEPSLGYPVLYQWVVAILAFWVTIQFVRTRAQAILAFALIALLAALQGVYGVLQALLGMGPESFEIAMGFSRAYGTFGMPNSYAAYLETVTLPLIPVLIWAFQHAVDVIRTYRIERLRGVLASTRLRRELIMATGLTLLLLAGVGAGLAGIAMSFSRGAWLGTAAAGVVIILLLGRRVVVTSLLGGLAIGLLLTVSAPGPVISVLDDRFTQLVDQVQIGTARGATVTEDNFAALERLAHWQTAIAMWDDHPWLGAGTGNFDSRFTEYAVHPQFTESQGHAHNYYLHLMAENGIVGLIAYAILLAGAVIIGWRAVRSPDPLAKAIGIGATGLTTALVIHNVVENLHVLNISIQIFAIWAIAYVASHWRTGDWDPVTRNHPPLLLYDSLTRFENRREPHVETGDWEQR